MTRCQHRLLRLRIPETWNLRFHSWSIPERDNSPKGSRASKAHGALHNSPKGSGASKAHGRKRAPRSLREEIFLVKKKFLYWKKRVPLCEKDVHTLKKFLIESIWWKIVYNSLKFYFTDPGLRNSRLNFRQFEETHLMENVIYAKLLFRGWRDCEIFRKARKKACLFGRNGR